MSAKRDKKRIDPAASTVGPDPVDGVTDPSRRARRRARRSRGEAAPATGIPDALAAITGTAAAARAMEPVDVEPSPEADEIAALTTRHRTEALTPTGPEPIAPRMRAFRFPAIVVVLALLVGAALVERRDVDDAPVATAPVDLARLAPVASAPGAQSSTFYCAGGTARGSTDPIEVPAEEPAAEDPGTGEPAAEEPTTVAPAVVDPVVVVPVVAEHTVTVANFSDGDQRATITAVPSTGDPVVRAIDVPARSRASVTLSDLVVAPFASALVETDGGSVAVEHQVQGPTGRSIAPCASSASANWYFPAGTTRLGTRHIYSVFNPFPQQAVVDFSFMVEEEGGRQATRESEKLQGIVIPPGRVVAVDITDIITVRNQVATTVTTRSGLGRVVVDQLQVSDGRSEWPENLALTLGAPAPAATWLFADSRPLGEGVETSYAFFNPGPTDADVEVYVEVDGQAPGTTVEPFVVTVRAGQYASVPVGTDTRIPVGFGGFVVASSRNGVPIVAERVMKQISPVVPAGVALTMGSPVLAREWLVPIGGLEGQTAMQVSIANPSVSESITLTVEAVGEGDAAALTDFDAVSLAPGARTVVDLSQAQGAAVLMLRVVASGPVVVGQWFSFEGTGTLSDLAALAVTGTLVIPGGEVTDRGEPAEVVEPEPYDGPLPPAGTEVPGTDPDAPPGTDAVVPEETTTTAPVETTPPPTDPATGAVIDPATGLPVDPAATPTTVAPA